MRYINNIIRGDIVLTNDQYVKASLEFNLFFLRIAKEHAIFAAASLPPRDRAVAAQLLEIKTAFETLLARTVALSRGKISREVLESGEIVTELTLPAEEATQFLTGLPINTNITKQELNMVSGIGREDRAISGDISMLNTNAIALTNRAIVLMTKMQRDILSCKAFSYTYPTMLNHVIRESRFAVMMLNKLQNKDGIDTVKEVIEQEIMWTDIMGEHSEFIRGYLDPSEKALFKKADTFANEFEALLAKTVALKQNPSMLPAVTKENLARVTELRNFKRQGAAGILACKVKSIIPPLLSDHVLREANHYLRLLRTFSAMK